MNPAEVVDIGREALLVTIRLAAPLMGVALGIGVTIALMQALTQIQEMTLTFVPKILGVFVAMIFFLPMMMGIMTDFMKVLADKIISIGM